MAQINPDESATGWQAIDRALSQVYGEQEPLHLATLIKAALGGPDPLDGISVYSVGGDVPHWHYVSYGFSDLYGESPGAEESDFGFELSFRLRRGAEADAPRWPANLMQNLARYVFSSGNRFAAGHAVPANGPIAAGQETDLTVLAFRIDPQLAPISTPNGSLEFLQMVALTQEEADALSGWDRAQLLALLAKGNPLLVADLAHKSALADPEFAALVDAGVARDGSSMAGLMVERLSFAKRGLFSRDLEITLGAIAVAPLLRLLRGRTLHGRRAELRAPDASLALERADVAAAQLDGEALTLSLPDGCTRELIATLLPKRGTYRVPSLPRVVFEIKPTFVRNREGNVERTIG